MKHVIALVAAVGTVAGCSRWAEPPRYGSLSFDEKRSFEFDHGIELFETSNGMKFALRRDPRVPIATIDVRYDVGAAADPPGRAGLAHLVEHLMFASREQPGAPTLATILDGMARTRNATTSHDGTRYTMTVPRDRLAAALSLEARRMQTRCEQLDDTVIVREREIVLAEGAERGDDSGYRAFAAAIYGADHPYARSVSAPEIAQATRAEICKFITDHYAPERASLVVTGDFDVDKVRALVGKLFGPIQRKAGAPRKVTPPAPAFAGERVEFELPVARPIAAVAIRMPGDARAGTTTFELAQALIAGQLARIDRRRAWVTDSVVTTIGDARAPVVVAGLEVSDSTQIEAATEEILEALEHLGEVRGSVLGLMSTSMALRVMRRWDDAEERGDWIARYLQYSDHNFFILQELREAAVAWPTAYARHQASFARSNVRRLAILPGGRATSSARALALPGYDLHVERTPVDPRAADAPAAIPDGASPPLERYQLANGLTVELAPDADGAIIETRLVFPVGYAHGDPAQPQVPRAAADLLAFDSEGYYTRADFDRLSWATDRGTVVDVEVGPTATTFLSRGLFHYGDWHLWYLSALIDQGRYASAQVNAARKVGRELSAKAAREGGRADDEGARAYRERLFGAGHPFARDAGSFGDALDALRVGQLAAWKRAYYRPRGATLIVSGRFDPAKIKREIDELFAPWSDVAPAPTPEVPRATPAPTASWFAFEDPDAAQVHARIGFALPPTTDDAPYDVVAAMLDDELRDVREGMAASYGVYANVIVTPQGGALFVDGALDRGRAGAATQRILAVIDRLRTEPEVRRAAFVRARQRLVLVAASQGAGAWAMARRRVAAAAAGRGGAPLDAEVTRMATVTLAEIETVLARDLDPARQVMALTGRAADLDAAYRELGHEPERFEPAKQKPPADESNSAATTVDPDFKPLRVGADGDDNLYHGDRVVGRDEFLRLAGRADVVDGMRRRLWLRLGLAAVGGVAVVGGVIYAFDTNHCGNLPLAVERDACEEDNTKHRSLGGVGAIGGGVLLVIAHYMSNLAPSRDELRNISAAHNRRGGRKRAELTAPIVTPIVSDRAVGLTLTLRF